jgi:hypothetical protein
MGSGLMASTPPQSSPGSSMEDVYKGMGMGTMPDRSSAHIQHQHQTVPPEQEQRASLYPYVIDNDAVAAWSNAPTGFECVVFVLFSGRNLVHSSSPFFNRLNKWSTFLSNFGELTQGNVQAHSGGQHQHEHQRVPQQHEQQPLSYPLIIDSDHDIRSNTPTGFKYVISVLFLLFNFYSLFSFCRSENGVPSLPS